MAARMSSSEDVRRSYDEVADEYARRIFDELAGKPLDRQLLDRFAASCAARPVHRATRA
jgi:hypothetical protein